MTQPLKNEPTASKGYFLKCEHGGIISDASMSPSLCRAWLLTVCMYKPVYGCLRLIHIYSITYSHNRQNQPHCQRRAWPLGALTMKGDESSIPLVTSQLEDEIARTRPATNDMMRTCCLGVIESNASSQATDPHLEAWFQAENFAVPGPGATFELYTRGGVDQGGMQRCNQQGRSLLQSTQS